jgi:hypothetical protein
MDGWVDGWKERREIDREGEGRVGGMKERWVMDGRKERRKEGEREEGRGEGRKECGWVDGRKGDRA